MPIKDDVFQILIENRDKSISGSDIARALGVTRAAVWKAIAALREEGVEVEACTNRGYRLAGPADILSEPMIRQYLRQPDVSIEMLTNCDSTNNVAKRLAMQGAGEGTLVVTETQTAGRGRLGRSFYSPGQGGVYMSVILRPKLAVYDSVLITAGAAVAVCRAIEILSGVRAQIKWVNDVYIEGKKVCGILTEAASDLESGGVEYIVVGIGINVRLGKESVPEELADVITTVEENAAGVHVGRSELIAAVANELGEISSQLESGAFLEEYRARSIVLGKKVLAIRAGECETVEVVGIDGRAGLVVRGENGQEKTLHSGEISIRPA